MKRFLVFAAVFAVIIVAFTGCNTVPEISSITIDPNPASPGQTVTFTCTSVDGDNDVLSYSWESVDEDTVYTGSTLSWVAPTVTGDYRFYLVVSDERGGYAYDSSLIVTVRSSLLDPNPQDVGTRQAIITWNASTSETWSRYEVWRSQSPDAEITGDLIAFDFSSRLDTTYVDNELFPATLYYYVVVTVDADGRSSSNEITFTTDPVDTLGGLQALGGGHGVRLTNTGNYIFCASLSSGVYCFGISNTGLSPSGWIQPQVAGNWAYDVSVTGYGLDSYLGIAFGTGGFEMDTIANPAAPGRILPATVLLNTAEATAVHLSGYDAFVGGSTSLGEHFLHWYDITNPAAPVLVDTLLLLDSPTDIFSDGSSIYVTMGNGGFAIVQATASSLTLNLISTYTTGDMANRVYVSGSNAFIAAGTDGLLILDVSNPTQPSLAAQWQDTEEGNNAQGVYVHSDIAYLADDIYGLRVIDVTNKKAPELKYTLKVGNQLMDVWVKSQGTRYQAIVADWYDAIAMIEW